MLNSIHYNCLFRVGIMQADGTGEAIGVFRIAVTVIEGPINGDVNCATSRQFNCGRLAGKKEN